MIQTLYEVTVSVHAFQGPESTDAIADTLEKLMNQFSTLDRSRQTVDVAVPPEVVRYVEDGRNPDIYTREFVELVQKENDLAKDKVNAYRDFKDVLAEQVEAAFPELAEDVDRIVDNTGGRKIATHTGELARLQANGTSSSGA